MTSIARISLSLILMTFALSAVASSATVPEKISFNQHIRPILADKCFACHGLDAKKRKAGLRLDTAEGAYREKDGDRAIVPGDLTKSAAWKRINSKDPEEMMPPPVSHKTLSDVEKATIKAWIEQGAVYQKHWAFEAPIKSPVPAKDVSSRNEIDAFLGARLKRDGLAFSPEADRATLIRRLSFALTGLPPSAKEVDEFVTDKAFDAYDKCVDRYLASPHFGEEMARNWLDVARYADTHGMHLDNERQMWAYRDWVVNMFNRNEPFSQFTIEQLAGDLLPTPTNEQLTATGFNRCNVTTGEGGSIDAECIYRYAVDRTATTVQTWMGLTGGCAVCHDHKFDPISHREFYSLYAFFHSAADPAMDGNALLTAPTVKLSLPEQIKKQAEYDEQIVQKQKALTEKAATIVYTDPASQQPPPPAQDVDTIWLDDDFPKGAKVTYAGKWVTAAEGGQVYSGKRALKRSGAGISQDFYESGATPLEILPNSKIFAYVWLDPKDMPKAIMMQFNTAASGWEKRAVWGDYDAIAWGAANTLGRVSAGALPEAGKWTRIEIAAEKVGLNSGDKLNGFALTQFGGTTYWDKAGVNGRIDPINDPARSFAAWRKQHAGKDTPGTPPEIAKLLKEGPAKITDAKQIKTLQDYFVQFVCEDTKPLLMEQETELAALKLQRDTFDKSIPGTFIFRDLPNPRESFVMLRGAYDKPGEKVEPDVPAIFPPLKKANPKARATRLDLAQWLVSPEHPLTARVTVNRFWQQFFGTGLVKTSGDFGSQGEPPSHLELLDWLAVTFRDEAWNVKNLVRRMVTSTAFRQSSRLTPPLYARDPENRLYARGPRFRLDAEQIRDNALYVSGLINLELGGKGVKSYQPPNIWEPVGFGGSNTQNYKQDSGTALYRRSLYTFLKRTAPAPFMSNFDAPSREVSCTRRERSDTPLQALQLMNDIQQFEAARALGQRMILEGGADPAARIAFAYKTVLSRPPAPEETAIVQQEFEKHLAHYKQDEAAAKKAIAHGESKPKADIPAAELAAYTLVANMLLNLDETVTRN